MRWKVTLEYDALLASGTSDWCSSDRQQRKLFLLAALAESCSNVVWQGCMYGLPMGLTGWQLRLLSTPSLPHQY